MHPLGTKVYLLKRYRPSDSFCTFFLTVWHFKDRELVNETYGCIVSGQIVAYMPSYMLRGELHQSFVPLVKMTCISIVTFRNPLFKLNI